MEYMFTMKLLVNAVVARCECGNTESLKVTAVLVLVPDSASPEESYNWIVVIEISFHGIITCNAAVS